MQLEQPGKSSSVLSFLLLIHVASLMAVGLRASTFDSILMIATKSLHWLQTPSRVLTLLLQRTPLGRPEEPRLLRVSFTHMQASTKLFSDMVSSTSCAMVSVRLVLGRILLASYSLQVTLRAPLSVEQLVVMLLVLRQVWLTLRVWLRRYLCRVE